MGAAPCLFRESTLAQASHLESDARTPLALGTSVDLLGWRAGHESPLPALTNSVSAAEATTMPHFLDWFVPVYLVISILILVGFGACIYYFEPGLQEAHKWRMQRPMVDRDLRKTLMVRDNLAFGGPEV